MTANRIRVALYARVSTLMGQNPDGQLVLLRDYAARRGFDVVREYIDHGISGVRERRPALDCLVRDAKHRRFDALLVTALDRVGRSTRHLLVFLEDLHHLGIDFISLREGIDLGSPIGRATMTILAAVAALERDLIADRVKNAIAAKRMAAKAAGIDWRPGRPSVLTADLVAEARELRAAGASMRAIAAKVGVSKSSICRALRDVPNTSEVAGAAEAETIAEICTASAPK